MSLLEDIFLQDEADEARELERVIEGDDIEDRPRSPEDSDENSEKEDEAEEDKRRVDPTKTKATRVVKNPRFVLNPARLTGPRGIQVIPEHYKDFKFKGKGHEKDDLDLVLKKLEHWAYRLYPKFQFEDCLKKIETLGKKRTVMVHLHKIRSNQFQSDEIVVQKDSSDDEAPPIQEEDEFDKLLQQQIELARATPGPGSARKCFETPSLDKRTPFAMPKATSSPSINDEQRERMLRNRRLAEERRLARLKNSTNDVNSKDDTVNSNTVIIEENENNVEMDGVVPFQRHNKSNVIDSSDSDEEITINVPITADVHNNSGENNQENSKVDSTNAQNDIFYKENEEPATIKRHNKSNVIDSSDSDEEVSIRGPITVDVQNITAKNNQVNGKKPNDIFVRRDYEEKAVTIKGHNKSNVIDSSDSDEEMSIRGPITVVVHDDSVKTDQGKNKSDNLSKQNTDINKNNSVNEIVDITEHSNDLSNYLTKDTETINLTDSDTLIKHNHFKENERIDITVNGSNKSYSSKDKEINSDPDNIVNIEEVRHEIVSENINTNEKDVNFTPVTGKEQNGKNKTNVTTEVEEIMDLDFADDF